MGAERHRFLARTDRLPRVTGFVEARCEQLGVAPQSALRLVLVVEELFINAVEHGYGGDCRQLVEVVVRAAGEEVELMVSDHAPPFDPFQELPEPGATSDPAEMKVGGLGRVLVAGMTSRHAYERCGSVNRVTVGVPRSPDVAQDTQPDSP